MAEWKGLDQRRLIILGASTLLLALISPALNDSLNIIAFAAVIILIATWWIIVRPASRWALDGALAMGVAGMGPAIAMGYWAWWWSDFCVLCEAPARDPAAFTAWAFPILIGSIALGWGAGWLGSQVRARAASVEST